MTFLRTKPRLTYSGLTISLANPSRFDRVSLLSANGGSMFNSHCLRPEMNSMQCDVRLAEDPSPLLPNTKVVMLLGQNAMHRILPETRNNTLGEMRGSVFQQGGIYYIPSYFPQDAVDFKNFEKEHNPLSKEYQEEEGDEEEDDYDSVKRHGRTSRKNYPFWLRADLRKAKYLLKHGKPPTYEQPQYHNNLSSDTIINRLLSTKGSFFYFDIETDWQEQNLQCFSFSFDGVNVYNVPVLDYNYNWAYTNLHRIMAALAEAIRDNTVVAHNGAAFDFFVLAHKYRIPVVKCYDTMLAMHRCFPDIEKSLGHCTSYWTWEKFHKDEDSEGYMTKEQMMARMKYCGKDVYTMALIRKAIDEYAATIPGLTDSIRCANESIRPYLVTNLTGIRYNQQEVNEKRYENDRLMEQYMRIINLLIGPNGLTEMKSLVKGKMSSFPNSNQQCCCYFHDILGYPVVARGKVKKDGTRAPSLGKKAMFKLRLNHDNPVIDFCLAYRQVKLETTTPLGFTPWKDDNDQVINPNTYELSNELQGGGREGSSSEGGNGVSDVSQSEANQGSLL
jgi:hypothetical protein